MEPSHIDKLLERYLLLLHEYSALRSTLETLQRGIYHNIARANFSGERGVRYGRDFYDDRMQASRRLEVSLSDEDGGAPEFRVVGEGAGPDAQEEESEDWDGPRTEGSESSEDDLVGSQAGSDAEADPDPISDRKKDEEQKESRERKKRAGAARDPLRWFGFGAPMSLRLAQDQAIQVVQTVAPRLASINAEMLVVEVEVRRARKRRAKAEAAAAAVEEEGVGRGGEPVGVETA